MLQEPMSITINGSIFLYNSYLFIDLCFNIKFTYLFFLSLFKAWKTKMTSPEKICIRNKLKKVYMSTMTHNLFCHAAASFTRHTRRMCSNVCNCLVLYHFRWYIDKEIGVSIKKGTKKKLVLKVINVVNIYSNNMDQLSSYD